MILTDIVQNLYKDDIVICDISGRNPNVFFELGMRLTFDKPTIILKDDATVIPFDTQGVRMIIYPIGLNYHKINKLKADIREAMGETFEKDHTNTFLKHFKDINIQASKLESQNLSLDEARMLKIENQLASILNLLEPKTPKVENAIRKIDRRNNLFDPLDIILEDETDRFIASLNEEDKKKVVKERFTGKYWTLIEKIRDFLSADYGLTLPKNQFFATEKLDAIVDLIEVF